MQDCYSFAFAKDFPGKFHCIPCNPTNSYCTTNFPRDVTNPCYFYSFERFRWEEVKIYSTRISLNFFDTKSLTLRIYDIFARIPRNVYCHVIRLRRRKENSTKFSYVRVKTKIGGNLWCGNRLDVSFHACVDAILLSVPRVRARCVEKNVHENEMKKEIEFLQNARASGRKEVSLRNGTETPVGSKEEDLILWF